MKSISGQIEKTYRSRLILQQTSGKFIIAVLADFANELEQQIKFILSANQKDLSKMDSSSPLYDRLLLNEIRLKQIANAIRKVKKLKDPTGQILEKRILENGVKLEKQTAPLGVVAAIFESRPNVVADIASLCIKSRNACILKGSKDADNTNKAIVRILHQVLSKHTLPKELVLLLPPDREVVQELFTATKYIDVIIPRGSNGLIQYVRENSRVPVIETGAGVCHTYIHRQANPEMAIRILMNAKTQRPSVCNALDTILLDEEIAPKILPLLAKAFEEKKVQIYADKKSHAQLKGYPFLHKAAKEDYFREFLSLACAIKLVKGLDEALAHIEKHGTRHSEAIVTNDQKTANLFLSSVDAATVYHNASTRFTDGEVFGLGAEVGISTQKLHARGPFAHEKLVTEKWVLRGNGQIRT